MPSLGDARRHSMTEEEYVTLLEGRWPSFGGLEPTRETMDFCERAVSDFPSSAKLWIIRGDFIQLADHQDAPPLSEAERSYRQAIHADPRCAEAYAELGHFLDAVMAKPKKAKQYFHKAWLLRTSRSRA
jgi:Tfp pilus assembly protein PilF